MHEGKGMFPNSLKLFKFMEMKTSMHKRSKSDPPGKRITEEVLKWNNIFEASHRHKLDMGQLDSCVETKKRHSPGTELQNSLKQEILQLQKQLEDQFVVRCALEKALSYRPISCNPTNENSIIKPTNDLIKEIAVLELEVVYLEKYLLSMYRKTFDQRVSSLSTLDNCSKSTSPMHKGTFSDNEQNTTSNKENLLVDSCRILLSQDSIENPSKECNDIWRAQTLVDSSINRSHSSLSQRGCSVRPSSPRAVLAEAVNSYHSLPLSMLERAQGGTSNVISLAEHFSSCVSDHVPETPNWLSEEMLKFISAIYCQLADPPLINHGFPPSPISFSSSMSESPPQGQYYMCSPECQNKSSSRSWLDNPFQVGSKDFSGPYSTVVEVQWICRDSQRLRGVKHMLQKFRSLVSQLERVDPRKMRHEEKLAFWVNVHNVLVMHAFLVYGTPQNNMKRISLLLKAAYNVGGLTISVDMIQSSILGCRLPRPGQWLQSLFFPKTKFKVRDARKAFAIEQPEPLLHFALCSGSHSDPAVRVYTPKKVFQELEAAKEEYIHTNFRMHKEQKILLPKIVDSYAKELGLCSAGLAEMIEHFTPYSLRKSVQQHQQGNFLKKIEWIPHNFNFRYLISKELIK